MDYGLNYKNYEANDIRKIEEINCKEINEIAEGKIVPNFLLINKDMGLRQYLNILQNEEIDPTPLFYIIQKEEILNLENIKLFEESIELFNFKYLIINLNNTVEERKDFIHIKEFDCNFKGIIIRPDYIIEKIIK